MPLTSLALAGALLETAAFWRGIGRARRLAAAGRRFERRLSARRAATLILGDSTGVGVGATLPEESIAGLLAADYPDADIVNVAVSGARIADATAQVQQCLDAGLRFDLALLHVGGNDVVADTPLNQLADDCDTLLRGLAGLAVRTAWLGPPDLGLAPLFPRPYAWVMASRSRAASQVFSAAAARHDVVFVDFRRRPTSRISGSNAAITSRSTASTRTAPATSTAMPPPGRCSGFIAHPG